MDDVTKKINNSCPVDCTVHTWHCFIHNLQDYWHLYGQLFIWNWINLQETIPHDEKII